MRLCHADAEVADVYVDGVHVRCMRMRAPRDVPPLWELVQRGRQWTVVTAPKQLELREPFTGLAPPEEALLTAAVRLGVRLAVNVTPPICRRTLLSRRCTQPRAVYVAEEVEDMEEAYNKVKTLRDEINVDSLVYVGDVIVLAWSEEWSDRWGL